MTLAINISLALVIVMVLVFVFKRYIMVATDLGVKVIFLTSAVLVVTALFYQPAFKYVSEVSLEALGTKSTVQSLDDRIESLDPRNAIQAIASRFGINLGDNQPQAEFGFLENELYPDLVSGLTSIYRVLTVVLGIILMAISIYLNYATFGATKVIELEKRLAAMEAQMYQPDDYDEQA